MAASENRPSELHFIHLIGKYLLRYIDFQFDIIFLKI